MQWCSSVHFEKSYENHVTSMFPKLNLALYHFYRAALMSDSFAFEYFMTKWTKDGVLKARSPSWGFEQRVKWLLVVFVALQVWSTSIIWNFDCRLTMSIVDIGNVFARLEKLLSYSYVLEEKRSSNFKNKTLFQWTRKPMLN